MTEQTEGLSTASADIPFPLGSSEFIAEKLRRIRAAEAATKEPVWPAHVLLPSLSSDSVSAQAKAVNDACESIDIIEICARVSKGYDESQSGGAGKGEVMIRCPLPEHPDRRPSASVNLEEQLWYCHACNVGGDKFHLAGHAYGLSTASDFWEIKTRLAEQLRGVKYVRPTRSLAPSRPSPSSVSPPGASSAPQPRDEAWETAIEAQKDKTLIRLEGDHRARQERASGLFVPPAFFNDLKAELAQPDPDVEWTIDGLHAVGGNTTITAGFKVGKTTFVANLIKALVDENPFLGERDVRPFSGRVALWNFEVEATQMKRNFRELSIQKLEKIWHLPLRGHNLNLMDDAAYAWALKELRSQEIEVLVLDPFSGVYYGDENDNSQINAFTKRLDLLKREAGVSDVFIPVHTGRVVEEGNERARGGAKLDDWTDNRWVLSKSSKTGDRYFKAEGRRVEQAERELRFDRETQTLAYSVFKGTRGEKAGRVLKGEILAYISAHPGCSKGDIESAMSGRAEAIRATVRELVRDFDVVVVAGSNRSQRHYLQGQQPMGSVL